MKRSGFRYIVQMSRQSLLCAEPNNALSILCTYSSPVSWAPEEGLKRALTRKRTDRLPNGPISNSTQSWKTSVRSREFHFERDRKQENVVEVEERYCMKGEMRGVDKSRIGAVAFQISKE
jgi:hypothetical protein